MFPLNDLSLKTQPVQLNKVTSNTESTIKQHELVSDDAIINELSSELVSCLGNGKFTPISEDSKLFNMLSEFKLLHSEYFEWGDYSLWFQDLIDLLVGFATRNYPGDENVSDTGD